MAMDDLDPFEFFALHSLTKRRPLFRWEEQAVTAEVMARLCSKKLVEMVDGEWMLTRLGEFALQIRPVPILGCLPRESDGILDELAARRIARRARKGGADSRFYWPPLTAPSRGMLIDRSAWWVESGTSLGCGRT